MDTCCRSGLGGFSGYCRRLVALSVLLLAVGAFPVQAAVTYFVDSRATAGLRNGTNWANAFIDLQAALAVAGVGDELWVAVGTYKPTALTQRTVAFQMKEGVNLYGGFAGNEVTKVDRNWVTNPTILSGDIGLANVSTDNSYHVIVGANAILDGFQVTGGRADGDPGNDGTYGGGLIGRNVSPQIVNCVFANNYASRHGGAVFLDGCANVAQGNSITNTRFSNNAAGDQGGAAYLKFPKLRLSGCTFTANSAAYGGGLYDADADESVLTDCVFENNVGSTYGGGLYATKESLLLGSLDLSNTILRENTASRGGGLMLSQLATATLTNCVLWSNNADRGAGTYLNAVTTELYNCTFAANRAIEKGGALMAYNASVAGANLIMYSDIAPSGAEVRYENVGAPLIEYSCVAGSYPGTGNISGDPLFVDPTNGDLRLTPGSPSVDAADWFQAPATDLEDQARYDDPDTANTGSGPLGPPPLTYADMGAYELQEQPRLSIADLTVNENDGLATMTVTLSLAASQTVTVVATTSDGTATAGADYAAKTGTLTWAAGELGTRTFTIAILDDLFDEADETVTVTLTSPQNATISRATAVLTITDNDLPPTLRIASNVVVSESATSVDVPVYFSGESGLPVSVYYGTQDGTATATQDYLSTSGVLTWPPHDTTASQYFTVQILQDQLDEDDYETVQLLLSNEANADVTVRTGELNIQDDDPTPILVVGDVTVRENEGPAQVTVVLTSPSGWTVTVYYETNSGTATSGVDFYPVSGTLSWARGRSGSQTIQVALENDTRNEGNEDFYVDYSNPVHAQLPVARTTVAITDDDTVIFVKANATGANDGTSWTNAYTSLQIAINNAVAGSELWVASGTYRPTPTTNRAVSFQMKEDVDLYGGFKGIENLRDLRNYTTNVTTLSGDIGTASVSTDNSYHVLLGANRARLDGFTVTGGYANSTGLDALGGGMLNDSVAPTVANCKFTGNYAVDLGGAVYNADASPTFADSAFISNQAARGGAVGNVKTSVDTNATFATCAFTLNQATDAGGAMYNAGAAPVLTECELSDNTATDKGGAIYAEIGAAVLSKCTLLRNSAIRGGAVYATGANVELSSCTLNDNPASADGGAVYVLGGAPKLTKSSFTRNAASSNGGAFYNGAGANPTVTECQFTGNSAAAAGGAVYNDSTADLVLTGCIFSSRNSATNGGALYSGTGTKPKLTSCQFLSNRATGAGGAIYGAGATGQFNTTEFSYNEAGGSGGALWFVDATSSLTGCTLEGNGSGVNGGAVYAQTTTISFTSCQVTGNVATADGGALYADDSLTTWTGTTVTDNVGRNGGALYGVVSASILTGCQFRGNEASANGGAISSNATSTLVATNCVFYGNQAGVNGGAISDDAAGQYVNCSLAGNVAVTAGGGLAAVGTATPFLANSVLWDNQAPTGSQLANLDTAATDVTFCCIMDGYLARPDIVTGDPKFLNQSAGDLRLGAGSSGIDAANGNLAPAKDLNGMARVDDLSIVDTGIGAPTYADLGAYERKVVTISVASATTISEGAGMVNVVFTLNMVTDEVIGVTCATADGTAKAGQSYVAASRTLSWEAGKSGPKSFAVGLIDDDVYAATQSFTIQLSDVKSASLERATSTVNIVDNDSAPVISVADASAAESAEKIRVVFHKPVKAQDEVTVDYGTADGTALVTSDYGEVTGTVTWASRSNADQTVEVPVVKDGIFEGNEVFYLDLSNPVNATLANLQATLTIVDDDQPTLAIADLTVSEGPADVTATVAVTRTGDSLLAAAVDYATADGTATAGSDYVAAGGTLNWAAHEVADKSFSVLVLNDNVAEANETVGLVLSNAVNARLGTSTATLTISDDDIPHLSFADQEVAVAETAGQAAMSVTLSKATTAVVTVQYWTSGGSATVNEDYRAASGTLTWAAGESGVKTFSIPVLNDQVYEEANKTVNVLLGSPTNAIVDDGEAVLTIVETDLRLLVYEGVVRGSWLGGGDNVTQTRTIRLIFELRGTYGESPVLAHGVMYWKASDGSFYRLLDDEAEGAAVKGEPSESGVSGLQLIGGHDAAGQPIYAWAMADASGNARWIVAGKATRFAASTNVWVTQPRTLEGHYLAVEPAMVPKAARSEDEWSVFSAPLTFRLHKSGTEANQQGLTADEVRDQLLEELDADGYVQY